MKYEVEQKFPVREVAPIEAALRECGAVFRQPIVQVDTYFAHPARDFAQTDEALRIRRVGDSCFVTYKGPKIDARTKTRREIELPLAGGEDAGDRFAELLIALGFRRVADVRKRRRAVQLQWNDRSVEVALDDVDHVGSFVELEIIADEDGLEPATATLASLASRLGLSGGERRSYLELLLGKNAPAT